MDFRNYTQSNPTLSADDGTLDQWVQTASEDVGIDLDNVEECWGDVFGLLFSGSDTFSTEEASELFSDQITAHFTDGDKAEGPGSLSRFLATRKPVTLSELCDLGIGLSVEDLKDSYKSAIVYSSGCWLGIRHDGTTHLHLETYEWLASSEKLLGIILWNWARNTGVDF